MSSSSKPKSKNDTWGEEELTKALRPSLRQKTSSKRDSSKNRDTKASKADSSKRSSDREGKRDSKNKAHSGDVVAKQRVAQKDSKSSVTTARSKERRLEEGKHPKEKQDGSKIKSSGRSKDKEVKKGNPKEEQKQEERRKREKRKETIAENNIQKALKEKHSTSKGKTRDHISGIDGDNESEPQVFSSADLHPVASELTLSSQEGSTVKMAVHSDGLEEPEFVTDVEVHKRAIRGDIQPMVEVKDQTEDDLPEEEINYEEDEFEDYNDEFEDASSEDLEEGAQIEEDHLDEIMDAIYLENTNMSYPSLSEVKDGENPLIIMGEDTVANAVISPRSRAFIDFSVVKSVMVDKRVISRIKQRGKELLDLIDLDVVAMEIFDLPPMSEYEVYMRSFGQRNARQVAIETGEDTFENDTQTEEISTTEKWTQHPQEGASISGGDKEGDFELNSNTVAMDTEHLNVMDSAKLSSFLHTAGRVISIIMEEENPVVNGETALQAQQKGKSVIAFSAGYIKLTTTYSHLGERYWKIVGFSPTSEDTLLLCLSNSSNSSNSSTQTAISSKGVLCVWNIREPSRPERLLISEGVPTCCTVSPSKGPLVFAGMEDGSLDLWDLRMSPSPLSLGEGVAWPSLSPAYSTARVLGSEGHTAPVRSMTAVDMPPSDNKVNLAMDSSSLGLSFQIATMDVTGKVIIWVVAELGQPDPHGSITDLGLAPSAKVKLIKSSTFQVMDPSPTSVGMVTTMTVHSLAFHPRDLNHFYLGTDTGGVLHCQRYGNRPVPREYKRPQEQIANVTSLAFSPWQPDHFVVGRSDGTLLLYNTKYERPLLSWNRSTRGKPIHQLMWSHHRPSVFIVLDDSSTIHLWDLLQSDSAPVLKAEAQNMKIASIALNQRVALSPGSQSQLVLSFEDGTVEVHQLVEQYSVPKDKEEECFNDYLQTLLFQR